MNMKKILAFALCLVLVAGLSIGGTLAWITANSQEVVNTFTVGDINIELFETKDGEEVQGMTNLKILPGNNIAKDPTVRVLPNSEDCWLFVTVTPENWPAAKVTYSFASTWTLVDGETNVYYYNVNEGKVASSDANQTFPVLTGNEIVVSDDLTKAEIEAIRTAGTPKLTFKAYAIQYDAATTAAAAWAAINE